MNAVRFGNGKEEPLLTVLPSGLYTGEKMNVLRRSLFFNDMGDIAVQYGVPMKVFRRGHYLKCQKMVPDFLYKGEDLAV